MVMQDAIFNTKEFWGIFACWLLGGRQRTRRNARTILELSPPYGVAHYQYRDWYQWHAPPEGACRLRRSVATLLVV